MLNKERIISISNEDKQFYIYFTGDTSYDEDEFGRPVEKEKVEYLDENFNKFIMNGSKNLIVDQYARATSRGFNVLIGPHSPEIETIEGKFVPNTDTKTIGLWEKATKEDLFKYQNILIRQNAERDYTRLF